ncbi:MAG: DUF4296 domain-containing protein [Vicingaceae bacterium]
MNHKYWFSSLLITCLFCACAGEHREKPTNLIARETMIEVLTDVQIFESAHQISVDKSREAIDLYKTYKWIFNNYKINEQDFRSSMEYYMADPKEFELLYDDIIIRITEKQAEMIAS